MSETLELASELISRPSLSPKDEGCQEIIINRLKKLGFTIEELFFEDVSNLWATHGSNSPVFVFAGHTDVVPPGPENEWESPPFEPTIRDGYLYGRGAADMKSGIAAMVTACERFISKNPNYKGGIGFLITSDEEAIAENGTKKVVEYLINEGIAVNYCIVGEASCENIFGDSIKNGRRGSINGKLTIHGIQTHIAQPETGLNAINECAKVLDTLCTLQFNDENQHFPSTCLQMSNINSGTGAENVIPGSLDLMFNLRYSPESTFESIQERIISILDSKNIKYDISWRHSGEPFLTTNGKLIEAITSAIQSITGVKPELSTLGGTSDGRFIKDMGCEVIEFGPINTTIHKVNECINTEELDKLSEVYEKTLINLLCK